MESKSPPGTVALIRLRRQISTQIAEQPVRSRRSSRHVQGRYQPPPLRMDQPAVMGLALFLSLIYYPYNQFSSFMDHILATKLDSPLDVLGEIRDRFKRLRLSRNLTQSGLAKRSGVTLGSLKRFETSGLIAFESLLKLALVLECLHDFNTIAVRDDKSLSTQSLDAILAASRERKKGRLT
jgi:DNA-binding Xre family transcriptional regulator